MNIELLLKAKESILARPDQFEMDWYFQDELLIGEKDIPAGGCGTAACIAGWIWFHANNCKTVAEAENLFKTSWEPTEAAGLIEIAQQRNGLSCLYSAEGWPEPFKSRYLNATSPPERAQAAADRIDHFIKTKGAE